MAISRIETNSIAPSQTLTTPIIATTMGVGGATPAASGSGITFPATQSASSDANTLDDYEEGTWTPAVVLGTITYSEARYTKVGRLVTVQASITTFSDRTTASAIQVGGLPFNTTTNRNVGSFFARYVTGTFCACYFDTGGYMSFYGATSGNYAALQHANLNNASAELYFELTYFAS